MLRRDDEFSKWDVGWAFISDIRQNPTDQSAHKRKLPYWINLAKTLERGDITALFLADTYGGHDTYKGSIDECIRRAEQWPVTDPHIVCTYPGAVGLLMSANNDEVTC